MSDSNTRFVMIGGFLGAGKTTVLLELARRYVSANLRVGVITNDQADQLVDTETFRTAGFHAEEIPHGCFCCKFNDLLAAAGRLADGYHPDILLAEPVGSCTDLVATVIKPLKKLYADRFTIAPYVALLDPARAFQALRATGSKGFSAKVTYLFKMQQHEADVVAINKADTLDLARLQELTELVGRNFPKAEVLTISARTGAGFDRLLARLDAAGPTGRNTPDIDYDTYAAGEAQLGWLNASLQLTSNSGFDADQLLLDLLLAIKEQLACVAAEPAHVKMTMSSGQQVAIANLVGSDRPPELSRRSTADMTAARLLINARVECAADLLRRQIESAVQRTLAARQIEMQIISIEHLAPGRPVPTYRLGTDE